ncbi:glucoamylase [Thermosporothrix hazakensis]|jgi:GH15 family glucan-1,4-alpha-glucosidase|uniref:Glucoamylase n=1 Tax=Thermosporothrix hazakensis TaxID=644383 RepID=A0A326UFK3_THEHA|nr:glycoside hydrolase family 15 protein [Thermosporothrix hazakensis]PZW36641.1 glucoamylase [Thermosporothrix hazakensis]GCE47291.1 glucan 1,3-alpha-glucosidase [Thermosporothrix hazakensis]
MPRDIPVGNGRLLVNFDRAYNVRDIYWPHIGQELHTGGDISYTGVWVDGSFAWLNDPQWRRQIQYREETLVTHVLLEHPRLQLRLLCEDLVDFHHPVFLRHMIITNLATREREVRLFFHYDWYLWNDRNANTVFYAPEQQALIAYKLRAYFLMNGLVRLDGTTTVGVSSWATGIKQFQGAEGTWRDAEDGVLGRNPIAQGSVDSTLALHVPNVAGGAAVECYHWLVAGRDWSAVVELDRLVRERGPEVLLQRTANYWKRWVNREVEPDFADLSPELVALYKRSLLIVQSQIDHGGAILAANDGDVQEFSNDSYSYMWPRDGALVANALSHAGYGEPTRSFFHFCNDVLTEGGYLLQKYNPDHSWGSSWEAWIDGEGQPQLPIQEDETALVIYSLWQHYQRFHDIEFVAALFRSLIVRAADFMVSYRDPRTGLPQASYDLWEERRGIFTFTTATVYAGLKAAAQFAHLFGETVLAERYGREAEVMRSAALQYLWDEERGHFLRRIQVKADGSLEKDTALDSSLCGLFLFGLLPADDPRVERTIQAVERALWVKTEIGGMARYENDRYHQVTEDLSIAPGNPWCICTLWLARYRIARARSLDELHRALPLLEWVKKRTLSSGVLAEQMHPFTGEPLSVSPLTWSHAEYIMTVRSYCEAYRKLA